MISPKLIKKGLFWTKGVMLVTGCTKVSEGCKGCWSEKAHAIRMNNPAVEGIYSKALMTDGRFNGKVQFNLRLLEKAAKAPKPQVIAIWNDLYHPGVTLEQVGQAHRIMANTFNSHHTFLVITKRIESAANYCEGVSAMSGGIRLPDNIWHIVTAENQARADERIPHLLRIPGKRGIIIEPMLGDVDIEGQLSTVYYKCEGCGMEWGSLMDDPPCNCPEIDFEYPDKKIVDIESPLIHQVILGGETGTGARPMHPDWARSVRDQCQAASVPFYFKSWGEWAPSSQVAAPGQISHAMTSEGHFSVFCREDMVKAAPSITQWEGLRRVGKKASGRLMDGKEHNALAWNTEAE